MLIETVLLAILTGWILKGRLSRLSQITFRGGVLIFIALFIRAIPGILKISVFERFLEPMQIAAPYLFILSFLLILTFAGLNLHEFSMVPIFGGTMMNLLVVSLNAGMMPVHRERLIRSGFPIDSIIADRLGFYHVLSTESTSALFLGDILLIPKPYPFPSMLSIGDLLLCAGVFLLIVITMTSKKEKGGSHGTHR